MTDEDDYERNDPLHLREAREALEQSEPFEYLSRRDNGDQKIARAQAAALLSIAESLHVIAMKS